MRLCADEFDVRERVTQQAQRVRHDDGHARAAECAERRQVARVLELVADAAVAEHEQPFALQRLAW